MSTSRSTPLLPVKDRIEPFWLTKRDKELCNARTTASLPKSADVVVIGSGLSGAMTSYFILEEAKAKGMKVNVVMLEADETCGSSTARNGGHCKPVTFIGYNTLKAKHGKAVANAMIELEENALGIYASVVEKEKIECDLHVTRSFDIFYDKADADRCKADFAARKRDFPEAFKKGDVRDMGGPEDVVKTAGVKGAVWSASYPAGHLWPYLLATSLIRICIQRHGLNLQTHTPALELKKQSSGSWTVKTPRGEITAGLVIATTNAYTASILPDFTKKIIPVRGTASSITPAPSHSPAGVPGPLKYTYGFRHGTGDTDYMIARQGRITPGKGDRSIILGGAKSTFLAQHEMWYNNINDNELMPGARKYFEDFMPERFEGWNGDKANVDMVWSGVLGYSADFKPFVGPHPDKEGVMVCAGFTGHGMPQIPACTTALSALAIAYLHSQRKITPSAQKQFDNSLPHPFRLTRERYESDVNIIKEYMGQGGGSAQGAIETSDEAAMFVKAKL